ncbi:MAG: DUF4147 domain-containing protein, partial [Granulosicoccaceae bacterium]
LQAGVSVDRALVVTKEGHSDARLDANSRVEQIEASHPVPDNRSLKSGEALQHFVDGCGAEEQLLLLVSGGASSLAERLVDGESLQSLQAKTQSLLAAGADIAQVNAARKRLSLIKAGGLCANCKASVRSWMLSDVEGDDPSVIGSGIGQLVDRSRQCIVASNAIARRATEQTFVDSGWSVVVNQESLYGDVEAVAERVAEQLLQGGPGAYVFGGEPTVVLPEHPGEGGRNQALALELALRLGDSGIVGLVAGTDGTDGPTLAAGGWFGRQHPDAAKVKAALRAADSGRYLRSTGQDFVTGPTGTNVMDLLVAVKRH